MSSNKIEISVKDIPEIIKTLEEAEKEIEFERKSKNLFINDLYKVCEMSLKLQNQLQQKENIIKEVREYIENHSITNMEWWITGEQKIECKFMKDANPQELIEILDKENK